jgi:hypothetical protein
MIPAPSGVRVWLAVGQTAAGLGHERDETLNAALEAALHPVATGCSIPKITASATAPAPLASANNAVGADGAREIASIALFATCCVSRPASIALIARICRTHAGHINAGRIGLYLAHEFGVVALRPQLQLAPARHDPYAKSQRVAKALSGGDSPIRILAVDVKHLAKGEDQVGALLQGHTSFSHPCRRTRHLRSLAPAPPGAGEPTATTTMPALSARWPLPHRWPRMASPFSWDRRPDRIPTRSPSPVSTRRPSA